MLATGFVMEESSAGTQGWMANSLSFRVSKKLSVRLCHESRYIEGMSFGDPFLDGLQGGLTYKLPAKFFIGAIYRRENLHTVSTDYNENRVALEGGWAQGLFGGVKMHSRIRFEARYFGQPVIEDHIRVRARFGLSYNTAFGKIRVAPFVATELFGDDRDHWNTYVNRNRFFLGMKFLITDHLGLTANYVRQDTRDLPVVHAFNTGFTLNL
jgi:hypothetical protein